MQLRLTDAAAALQAAQDGDPVGCIAFSARGRGCVALGWRPDVPACG
ncbi:hypothetical protein ABZ128_20150 [Streptomyces sp. NPDC006326]